MGQCGYHPDVAYHEKTDDQLIQEFVQESENAHPVAGQSRALELIRRQLVATRDLEAATEGFRKSSDKASKVLIFPDGRVNCADDRPDRAYIASRSNSLIDRREPWRRSS